MAAGFLRELAGDRVTVLSAGTMPKNEINPMAIAAMAEQGIDISNQEPKVLTDDSVKASDYVITMGCGDECPWFAGKIYLDWVLDDPAGLGVDAIRPIRDKIQELVIELVKEIDAKP
jgi:protein-tyrosine-phosphatase